MSTRKEKEKEFFIQHMDTFRALKIADPFFAIKTAFFQKGKFGRQVQFFESELTKGEDIYIEFYDNVKDGNGTDVNIIPMHSDRQLFKYRYNPFFAEEYEQKENMSGKGENYITYTVPVSELLVVLKDGTEITHSLYEKRKADAEKEVDDLPKLQSSLSIFPDFEEQFAPKNIEEVFHSDEESASDILLRIATEFQKLAQKLK